MRGELHLDDGVIVREIRPMDLKRSIDVLTQSGDLYSDEIDNTLFQAALLSHSDLIQPQTDLTVDAVDAFIAFNDAFFSGGRSDDNKSLKSIADDLNHACAVLIHHGHIDCWTYGWEFFQATQDLYKE